MRIPEADERRKNLIGGEWRPPTTGQHEPCVNPADTREVIGLWPKSGAEDARAAVDAAAQAFPGWAQTPGPERGRILGRAHQILAAKVDLLSEALCREEGKTLGESRGEVTKGLNLLEFYSGEGLRTHFLAEALVEAGLPPGVLNVVTGPGSAVGNALVDDPRIRAVSFTGSNAVGLKLYERAARRGIKVT